MSAQPQLAMYQNEHIENTMFVLPLLMHELELFSGYMRNFLFQVMRLGLNSNNFRLYTNLRMRDGSHFREDMLSLLDSLSIGQVIRIERFLVYLCNNRRNPNLSHMITAYNN